MLDVASRLPENLSALNRIDGLPAGLIRRSGKAILAEVAASENDNSARRPPAAPSEAQKAQLKSAQKHVAKCASELGLAAETVASKRDLSAIVINGNRNSRVLSGWRRELLGDDLLKQL